MLNTAWLLGKYSKKAVNNQHQNVRRWNPKCFSVWGVQGKGSVVFHQEFLGQNTKEDIRISEDSLETKQNKNSLCPGAELLLDWNQSLINTCRIIPSLENTSEPSCCDMASHGQPTDDTAMESVKCWKIRDCPMCCGQLEVSFVLPSYCVPTLQCWATPWKA